MSVNTSTHMSIHLPIHMPVHTSIHTSTHVYTHLAVLALSAIVVLPDIVEQHAQTVVRICMLRIDPDRLAELGLRAVVVLKNGLLDGL